MDTLRHRRALAAKFGRRLLNQAASRDYNPQWHDWMRCGISQAAR